MALVIANAALSLLHGGTASPVLLVAVPLLRLGLLAMLPLALRIFGPPPEGHERTLAGLDLLIGVAAGGLWLWFGGPGQTLLSLLATLDLSFLSVLLSALGRGWNLRTLLTGLGLLLLLITDLWSAQLGAPTTLALWVGVAALLWLCDAAGSSRPRVLHRLAWPPVIPYLGALSVTLLLFLRPQPDGPAPWMAAALLALVAVRVTVDWHWGQGIKQQLQGVLSELEGSLRARTEDLSASHLGGLFALGASLEARDVETAGHTLRVVRLARALSQALHLSPPEERALVEGAFLHDIGKLTVPDGVLLKPGRLSQAERHLMQVHTTSGHAIAARIPQLAPGALDVIRHHHERWDGAGYPFGLSGMAIPPLARIFAVCDVYDALVSARPYKPAWSAEAARAEVERQSGQHFDPAVVRAFLTLDLGALGEVQPDPGEVLAPLASHLGDPAQDLQRALRYAEAEAVIARLAFEDQDLPAAAAKVISGLTHASELAWAGLLWTQGDEAWLELLWHDPRARSALEAWTTVQRRPHGPAWPALHAQAAGSASARSEGLLPLQSQFGRTVALVVHPSEGRTFQERDLRLLDLGAQSLRLGLERQERTRHLERTARRDPLTGLGNRRAFEEDLAVEIGRAHQAGHGGLLLVLDLDGFKWVNDQLGHAVGDQLLRDFALALQWNLRRGDLLYRIGGDEFALVVPNVPLRLAESFRARVRSAVASVRHGDRIRVDVSVGVAAFPAEARQPGELLHLADARMYEHKRGKGPTSIGHADTLPQFGD